MLIAGLICMAGLSGCATGGSREEVCESLAQRGVKLEPPYRDIDLRLIERYDAQHCMESV
jgi:hypothetical protein